MRTLLMFGGSAQKRTGHATGKKVEPARGKALHAAVCFNRIPYGNIALAVCQPLAEDVDVEDPTDPTDEIGPDQMVTTSLKNDVFDINSINKVYGSWGQTEKSAALHAPVLITSTTAFSYDMLS